VNAEDDSEFMRAVVIVSDETQKGTARSPQEYSHPLVILSGRDTSTFREFSKRLRERVVGRRTYVNQAEHFVLVAGRGEGRN
jgi:hypothetical protein